MAYYAVRRQLIAGHNYEPGERVPVAVLNRLKPNVLNAMIHLRMSGQLLSLRLSSLPRIT